MPLLFPCTGMGGNLMEVSPRLRAAAELVPQGAHFADIGTDHAYLPVWLILHGIVERAIATDLRPGPLERARETARKYDVEDRMDFRLCDGLAGLSGQEADTIAIAGMGGEAIARILSRAPWTKEGTRLILQPMSSQPDLRQWLAGNGYAIASEHIVREGEKFYIILLARGGTMPPLTPAELWAGRQSGDPLRGEYLDSLLVKTRRALAGQRAAERRDEAGIVSMTQILDGLTAMKKEWDAWQR